MRLYFKGANVQCKKRKIIVNEQKQYFEKLQYVHIIAQERESAKDQ